MERGIEIEGEGTRRDRIQRRIESDGEGRETESALRMSKGGLPLFMSKGI